MAKSSKAINVERSRVDEDYILNQFNYHYDSENFRQRLDRMESGDQLYRGELSGLFPEDNTLPDIPFVENKFKNALHDIARLAAEGRGAVKAIPRGDRDRDMKGARRLESINEGYWTLNQGQRLERKLYLDLAGAGSGAISVYANASQSEYPIAHYLNPRFGYPDVRNGKLQTYLQAESVKERVLARQFPHLGLDAAPDNPREVFFVCLHDEQAVWEAVVLNASDAGTPDHAQIVKKWEHGIDRVPVAFEMLDTYDGAFHGLFEQLSGPLVVRNKIVKFMVDYLESIVHAPIVAEGVINPGDTPGPEVIYQLDPNSERASMGRLAPAAPANTVFGMLQYMQDQEEKESIQPPSRAGNVSQSIASGSFVDRTQGQLTSVVKELQDKMASLREQYNEICMKLDEAHLDFSKPLIRPVSGDKEYTPSKDINGWYFHEVKFGAGAGLDRLNADQRVQAHLAARLISREEARAEIDYLDDSASSQDKIDRENLSDVIFQRMVQDPATPMSALGAVWLDMKKQGKSLDEALEAHLPEILAKEQELAAAAAPAGLPAPEGAAPAEGELTPPEGGGGVPTDLAAVTQRPPLSLIQVRP